MLECRKFRKNWIETGNFQRKRRQDGGGRKVSLKHWKGGHSI